MSPSSSEAGPPLPASAAKLGFLHGILARGRSLARRFLLITIVLIGALCGVLAVLFQRFVELARGTLPVLRRAPAFPTSSPQVSHALVSTSEFSNDTTSYVWWLKQALA